MTILCINSRHYIRINIYISDFVRYGLEHIHEKSFVINQKMRYSLSVLLLV